MFKVSFAMYSQVKLFVFSAMCCKSYRLITTFHDVEAFSNFYSHGSWLPTVSVMWGRPYSRKRRARDVRRATERAAGSQPSASGHAGQAVSISG